jgi:predicted permease
MIVKIIFSICLVGFWTWDFNIVDEQTQPLSSVNRNFAGFAREVRQNFL